MRERVPECPRCGYDLSGAVAAWPADSCPCEGRCSECGLTSLWRDVLNPKYAVSNLFFETARRGVVGAFFRTWWQSLRPWELWRGAQMQFALNGRRLVVFVLLAIVGLWGVGSGLALLRLALSKYGFGGRFGWTPTWDQVFAEVLWPVAPVWWWWRGYAWVELVPPWLALAWLWLLVTPLTFRLVPQTLRRARVRWWHVVRIWAYSLVGVPLAVYGPMVGNWAMDEAPWVGQAMAGVLERRGLAALFLLALWSAWIISCWGSAAKHYLRLERPWMVAVVLVGLGGLAVVTLTVAAAAIAPAVAGWMMNELS